MRRQQSIPQIYPSLFLFSVLLLFFLISALAFGTRSGAAQSSGASTSAGDIVWVEDSVPAGATYSGHAEDWYWYGSWAYPAPFSGNFYHQSNIVQDMHQHYFYNATETLAVNAGETLFAYVFLDPMNPPSQVMLQWCDGPEGWEHRAYWGQSLIPWGAEGTNSRRYMGPLPPTGQWVKLEVPASMVGLEGRTAHGMAFTLYGGTASWDYAGKSPVPPAYTNLTRQSGVVTTQSTTVVNAVAARAVDGNQDGYFPNASVTHTDYQAQPWWQVDLGSVRQIDEVKIFNRTDCCPERLTPFYLFVSDVPFTSTDLNATRTQAGVSSYYVTGNILTSTSIGVGRTGRYVRVQLEGTNFLSLAEVEVWGVGGNTPTPPPPNIFINDITVAEGNSGTTTASFTVTLSSASNQTVSVDYVANDDAATSPDDFSGVGGTLIFTPGQTSRIIQVSVVGDTKSEDDENFVIDLTNPANATVADDQGVGVIINDDAAIIPYPEPAQSTPCTSLQNVAVSIPGGPNCATVQASSTRAGFPATEVIDGDYIEHKSTNGYWSDNTVDNYTNDWITVTFNQPQKLAVVRLFFLQDVSPPIDPTKSFKNTLRGNEAMREFKVHYRAPNSTTWNLMPGGHITPGSNLAGKVMVPIAFTDLTDVAALKVEVKQGGLSGTKYSKIVEIQAWRSLIPHSECMQKADPDPCGSLADLDWAMKNYAGAPPHPNWADHLDWDYSRWDLSSENWGMLAHAIALWKPIAGKEVQNELWWSTVLDCQTGAGCNASATIAPKLRFFKGSELFSSDYDASVTLAVASVHYWARLRGKAALRVKAERYLRATWGAYTLAAVKTFAPKLNVRVSANVTEQIPYCQKSSAGTAFFIGPFIAMAGMRSPAAALCQDDRGPLYNRAIERPYNNPNENKREAIEKRAVGSHIQTQWGANQNVNVYGLNDGECKTDGLLWKHVLGEQLAHQHILDNMFSWVGYDKDGRNYGTYRIHTIVPYRFLGWGGSGNPVRMTVMEDNRNSNTAPTYAVKYDPSTLTPEVLYPWNAPNHRKVITRGYGRLSSVTNPASVEASNIDPADGESYDPVINKCPDDDNDGIDECNPHSQRTVTMPGSPTSPIGRYHIVLSPGDPQKINW